MVSYDSEHHTEFSAESRLRVDKLRGAGSQISRRFNATRLSSKRTIWLYTNAEKTNVTPVIPTADSEIVTAR